MRALLRKAEIIKALEDGRYGKGKRGDELPEELQRRSSRLEWIRTAKAESEAEGAAAPAQVFISVPSTSLIEVGSCA